MEIITDTTSSLKFKTFESSEHTNNDHTKSYEDVPANFFGPQLGVFTEAPDVPPHFMGTQFFKKQLTSTQVGTKDETGDDISLNGEG